MNQDDQIIMACDDNGVFSGEYIPKEVGHTGQGKRHLAIAVLLYNGQGKVLLQQRKHRVFDDETFEEATQRCLERE